MDRLPFDRVRINEEGNHATLTLGEFLAFPLPHRIRLLLERRVDFFLGSEPIERRTALQALRAIKGE